MEHEKFDINSNKIYKKILTLDNKEEIRAYINKYKQFISSEDMDNIEVYFKTKFDEEL